MGDQPGTRVLQPPGSLIRNANLRNWFVSYVLSGVGDQFRLVALTLWVFVGSDESASTRVVLLLTGTVPGLVLSFFSGVLADLGDKRRIMIVVDLVRAALSGVLVLAVVARSVPLALLSVGLSSLVAVLFGSSAFTLVPRLVDEEQLPRVNGVYETLGWSSSVVGPALASIVYLWQGAAWAFGVDAASFLMSAAFIGAVKGEFDAQGSGSWRSGPLLDTLRTSRREAQAGFAYVWRHPTAKWFILTVAGPTITANANAVGLVFLLKKSLSAPLPSFGFVLSLNGLAAVVAAALVTVFSRRFNYALVLVVSVGGMMLSQFIMGLAPDILVLGAGVVVSALANAPFNIAYDTVLQTSVAPEFLGRVEGADRSFSSLLEVLVLIASGAAVSMFGARWLFVVAGVLGVACMSVGGFTLLRRLRPAAPQAESALPAAG